MPGMMSPLQQLAGSMVSGAAPYAQRRMANRPRPTPDPYLPPMSQWEQLNQMLAETPVQSIMAGALSPLKAPGVPVGAGMIGYHGTPRIFKKFDPKKIGTGEGTQAFGYGHYIAENPMVAGTYGGKVMELDLPDEKIAQMLDWDLPLSSQTEMLDRVSEVIGDLGITGNAMHRKGAYLVRELESKFGPERAANIMAAAGIPGVKFLDRGSRGKGKGTRNFVVFPEEGHNVKILGEKNQPVTPER